jgi:Fe-S cluster assembly protein SufD
MTPQLELDAMRALAASLPNASLAAMRRAALAQLSTAGLPGRKDEDWKYTDLSAVVDISNAWAAAGGNSTDVADESIVAITDQLDVDWLVFRNGNIDPASLAELDRPGIKVRLLSEETDLPVLEAPLADWNAALLSDGLAIAISKEFDSERPVGLLFIDSAADTVGASHTRVLIELDDDSSGSFIEYHASAGDVAHYANNIVDCNLGVAATARFVRIQNRDENHSQTGFMRASLAERSTFHHAAFDFGGNLVRNDLDVQILGPDTLASFCGLYLANGTQHIDNHTRVDHKVGPARSEQEYRGILTDSARCIWNGKAIVHAGADGTDANQANHNLLLSERSEIDAKPELEIYADDVKCSHGTTVGQLDETALFYLRTRGIDDASARHLLTRAFAQTIVAMTPVGSVEALIGDLVVNKLEQMIAGGAQ